MRMEDNLRLSIALTDWYKVNKRDLPWRDTKDPYLIWLSEVILQQTRVDQGYSYYNRFVAEYPTIEMLAKADEDNVLKLWQGLGYYSRARNLHSAAKMVVDKFGGVFPKDYKDVLSLKGVGEYTAAAIVSFSYGQPYAVVDGNVYRVLSRVFAIDEPIDSGKGQRLFKELAATLLDISDPGLHNQSIMEFGALQCVPVSPDCGICPVSSMCLAYAQGQVGKYPVKEGKKKNRVRYFNYLDIRIGDDMYLRKRTDKDIWQGLYELPMMETDVALSLESLQDDVSFLKLFSGRNIVIKHITQIKHVLSHQTIYADFYKIYIEDMLETQDYLKIKVEKVGDYPVSRLVHKYLEME